MPTLRPEDINPLTILNSSIPLMTQENYCVIMAGGVGSRFWPLSIADNPKQFLDVMGTGKSFIRATYERFLKVVPAENFLVVTSAVYKDHVLEHLPELSKDQVLLEPMRRNTAPCIAYASMRIKTQNPNARMVVTPADHFVTDPVEFSRIIALGLDYVKEQPTLLTIGIKPSRPETGYGYIETGDPTHTSEVLAIKNFVEKPDWETAERYVASGEYLWNSGIFIWSVDAILREFERQLPQMYDAFAAGSYSCPSEQAFIDKLYPSCQNISIDYGIMEKAHSRVVVPADFGWSDIGTWGSLYTHLAKDTANNATVGATQVIFQGAENCIVHLPKGHRAVIEGLDGYLVAYRDGNLIVCKLEDEQEIKNWTAQWN